MSFAQDSRLEVRPLIVNDAETCDQIVLTLPRHFGLESGRRACAQAVRTSEGWVAVLDGRVVGFLTVQSYFDTTVEITWMAVHAEFRGRGIGRRLIERLRREVQARGYRLLLVSTLAPSYEGDTEGPAEEGYAATRAFYQAVGFLPLQEVPLYWGVGSQPALLLVMPLQ
ncbi:MAG: GNAT family N-acetyltransferase [Ktedonobacteraceae bacterium]|nr:GNAT family N-acetyltransferase [Ktedonobacteraceae bacterium]MBO0792084.1 GNAT family N-acetyltransferase [Ktedonobacteraceae bacterium]